MVQVSGSKIYVTRLNVGLVTPYVKLYSGVMQHGACVKSRSSKPKSDRGSWNGERR